MPTLSNRRKSGQLLLELLLAMGLLGLVVGLVFLSFRSTVRVFGESTLRQSAEQQLNAIRVLLERDTELTNFWLAKVAPRTSTNGSSRDAFSMVAVSDWNNSSRFQSGTFRPAWDRQVVWYATEQTPGRLVRQANAPTPVPPSTYLNSPYSLLSPGVSDSSLESGHAILSTRYLSEDVVHFQVTSKVQNATLRVKLHLQKEGNYRRESMERAENNLEVDWTFCPKNTWPPL